MCAEWGLDNKAMCCSVRFIAVLFPLLLPCAGVEGMRKRVKRQTQRGELGEKAESVATWVVKEASVMSDTIQQKHQIFGVSLLFLEQRCHKNDFLSKKTESMIVLM